VANEPNTAWIYCNYCRTRTRHVLVGSHSYDHAEEANAEWGDYRLWKCAGCDTGTMEDHYPSDYANALEGGQAEADGNFYQSLYHPKRAHSTRPRKYFTHLPAKLRTLYDEVLASLNEGLPLLCAAGLRALVEGVCADKGIAGRNLQKKIEGMTKLLPKNIVKNLHGFRFIGNRAVHELEAPSSYQLQLAIDVIEDILNFLYALDYKASLLGKATAFQAKKPTLSETREPLPNAGRSEDARDPEKP